MDWLTFTARLIEALAWPVAAVAVAAIFHRQLKGLLSRIRRGTFGGAELEFEQEVRAFARELEGRTPSAADLPTDLTNDERPVEGTPEPSPPVAAPQTTEDPIAWRRGRTSASTEPRSNQRSSTLVTDVLSLSESELGRLIDLMNPRTIILNSWRSVERALRDAGLASGNSRGTVLSTSVRAGLSNDQYGRFVGLRTLRNRVVHDVDVEPTIEAALEYAHIAREFVSQLPGFSEQHT